MERTLTKFRTRYYIRGEPERSSHRRHMAMLHQYFNLIGDVKRLTNDNKAHKRKPTGLGF